MNLPKTTKALLVKKSPPDRNPPYHDAAVEERRIPSLKPGEVLVRMGAVAFNRRDLWIRLGQYPGIGFGSVFGADGAGTVVGSRDVDDPLLNKRVFLTPMRGWRSGADAPETPNFAVVGGVKWPAIGTFAEHVVVEREEVLLTPEHLDDVHMSAWPVGGLTAWRAAIINARIDRDHNVLITGIGGGVALLALQICVAKGAHVWVSSGNQDKIKKAVALGAKGGVNYKDKDWPAKLASIMGVAKLDSIIDSGGGDLMAQVNKVQLLKIGGRVACYGMTASPTITFTMREVMRNQQLIGSTMGSVKDLVEATEFLSQHRIVPAVSHVLNGLEDAERGFELMKTGDQFGKIVIKISGPAESKM